VAMSVQCPRGSRTLHSDYTSKRKKTPSTLDGASVRPFQHQFLRLRAHQRAASAITCEDNAARRAAFPATLQKPPSYKAFRRLGFSRAGNRQAPPATRERSQIMPARRP
jgi:hypothetical protein